MKSKDKVELQDQARIHKTRMEDLAHSKHAVAAACTTAGA
jgi:hypothetical protein